MTTVSKLYYQLGKASDDEPQIGNYWLSSSNECGILIKHILANLISNDQNKRQASQDYVLSEKMVLLINSFINEEAYLEYTKNMRKEYLLGTEEYMKAAGLYQYEKSETFGHYTRGTIWAFIMIVNLSAIRTNNFDSCQIRINSAFKQAGIVVPRSIMLLLDALANANRFKSSKDFDIIDIYHNALWTYPSMMVNHLKIILTGDSDSALGNYCLAQIRMVASYTQMTFVSNIKEFMTTSLTSARIMRPVIQEYKKLLSSLSEIKDENPDINEEHFKLLRAKKADLIDSAHYPFLSSIVSIQLEEAAKALGRVYIIRTSSKATSLIRQALSMPLPSNLIPGGIYGISDEDLAIVNLARDKTT